MRNPRRSIAALVGAVAIVLAVAMMAAAAMRPATPQQTVGATTATASPRPSPRLVASVAAIGATDFSWSPSQAMLLVSGPTESRVYDRGGKLLAAYPHAEGWLDATHLIGADGSVVVATTGAGGALGSVSPDGDRVVANGHGAAAIVTGTATCSADPLVRWYRDGVLGQTEERANPIGWSPDGTTLLLGHGTCVANASAPAMVGASGSDATLWRGSVDLVDFASGKVEATLPDVQGELAFEAGGESIAAQSSTGTEVLDDGTPEVTTLSGVRFLGWLDTETIFVAQGRSIVLADLDPPTIGDASDYTAWQVQGPNDLHLAADAAGGVTAILAEDGSPLIDLSARKLSLTLTTASGTTFLQPSWWSSDGRTVALPAGDGTSIELISVD